VNAQVVSALLREPNDVASRCERPEGLRELALTSLICLAVGAAVFGGVVGSFRGGLQIGYSAVKLLLALLTTLVVSVPAFHALAVGFGGKPRLSTIAALALTASARAALVLVGLAPVLWLAVDRGLGYHGSVLLASVMYLASGLAAVTIVLRGLGGSLRAWATAAACALVFFGVLGQTAWMLRPFFGRPSQASIPFVRAREGGFADAVVTSGRSAAGIYDHSRSNRALRQVESLCSGPEGADCVEQWR
jgi:hypothetical protein